MKRPLLIIAILCIGLVSCDEMHGVSSKEIRYGANGDSTVYVHYVDDNGTQQDFFMEYMLYNSLFNNGGYGSVYHYYNNHPSYFSMDRQRNYYHYQPRTVNHYHINSSSPRSSSHGYMRSPSRSYSSPSRSHSSPSRGYSSPSRSYSSPSRSHSSPSRSSSHH